MYKKKEIIIIITIISLSIFLAFLPSIINNKNEEEIIEEKDDNNLINIRIIGEIKVDELNIEIPKGFTYGYIISKIGLYLNNYSVIDNNKLNKYYEDSVIIIESLDTNKEYNIDSINLININKASKDELVKLYGIGEKRSEAIIEYRSNKKIESFEELKELLGVSNEVISNIKEKATL